jgi:hypothetical protein
MALHLTSYETRTSSTVTKPAEPCWSQNISKSKETPRSTPLLLKYSALRQTGRDLVGYELGGRIQITIANSSRVSKVQADVTHPPPIPHMPAFPSNPLHTSPLQRTLRRYPLLFGLPFLAIIISASFGLQSFSQTRYDLHDQKVTEVRLG